MALRSLPFVPVMQGQKHRRRVRPSGTEDEVLAGQRIGRMDRRNREKVFFNFAQHRIGSLLRRTIRQLDDCDEVALIFFRQEARGNRLE